eukprot:s2487_g10.t1
MADTKPWKCSWCKRLVKAKESYCPTCKYHWQQVYDPTFVQIVSQNQTANDQSWIWESHAVPGNATARTRSSSSRRRRKGKGKNTEYSFPSLPSFQPGKGSASSAMAPSPFAGTAYSTQTAVSPWMTQETYAQDTEVEQAQQDLLMTVQKHFPDPSSMPQDVKSSLERYEKLVNKQVTKNLHKETKHMDKARTAITEIQKAKDAHRKAWVQHITEAAAAWKAQMIAYQKQQTEYARKLTSARSDLENAHRAIQDLTIRAGPTTNVHQPKTEPMEDQDKLAQDEQEAKQKIQEILAECATMITVEDEVLNLLTDEEEEQPKPKRARSIDNGPPEGPGGGSGAM